MELLAFLIRQSRALLALAVLSGAASGIAGARLAAALSEALVAPTPALGLLFFGLCALHLVGKSVSEIALIRLTQAAVQRMRVDLSRKLLAAPQRRLQELGKPGLLVILTKDIDTVVQAFTLLPVAFCNAIITSACLGYMAWIAWELLVLVAVFLLLCVYGYHLAERRPLAQLRSMREQMDVLYRHFRSLVEGSRELQLNAARGTAFVDGEIATTSSRFSAMFVAAMTSYTWVINIGSILFYVVLGSLIFVVPRWLPQPPGTMVTFALVLLFLVRPLSELMSVLPGLRQAGIALRKIAQLDRSLEDAAPAPCGADRFAAATPLCLELAGVRHQYRTDSDDGRFMLGPIDLRIDQGELVFIVGGNGSGKTTLAMILLGLYAPETGAVRLNGVTVDAANAVHYRQHFSAVFADFHLFENLPTAAAPDLAARASDYIARLGMARKVTVKDGRFSTTELSTGQRKRLALVAAYLEDRPVYLFDEWAADQDPAFKRVFYTTLLPELKARGKTVIVITHDDAYFGLADRIVRLEDGRLRQLAVADPAACE
jgi:putative ATP-binding cassette transporter